MTAEIVIGNGFGLVLCADTATTRQQERTYDGARKLIGLPLPHRIGVLHAGMVTFHGVPFETLVENWLHGLPSQRFARVSDYADSFREYLSEAVPTYLSETEIAREYLLDWRERLHQTAEYLRENNQFTDEGLSSYFTQLVEEYDDEDKQRGGKFAAAVFEVLGEGSRRNPLESECLDSGCSNLLHSSLEGLARLNFQEVASDATLKIIFTWIKLFSGLMHPCFSKSTATIVFAGYGEKDALPALIEMQIEAYSFGRLFSQTHNVRQAIRRGSGFVLFDTFGQSDEIWRFIREAGLSPHYHQTVVRNSLSQYDSLDQHSEVNELDEKMESNDFGKMSEEITHELEQVAERNIYTALASLASMNLKNLGTMAQRLVLLQNLSLDLRGELPTVGAELVTATVTLQHGFAFVGNGYLEPGRHGLDH